MRNIIILLCLSSFLSGCANLVASTAGTFIGNIASDKYIKAEEAAKPKQLKKDKRK